MAAWLPPPPVCAVPLSPGRRAQSVCNSTRVACKGAVASVSIIYFFRFSFGFPKANCGSETDENDHGTIYYFYFNVRCGVFSVTCPQLFAAFERERQRLRLLQCIFVLPCIHNGGLSCTCHSLEFASSIRRLVSLSRARWEVMFRYRCELTPCAGFFCRRIYASNGY